MMWIVDIDRFCCVVDCMVGFSSIYVCGWSATVDSIDCLPWIV